MKQKYKSGINRVLLAAVIVYNIVIVLLFSTKIFTTTMFGVRIGFFLLFIDLIFVIPTILFTFYELRDDYLYIHDYPVRAYKIKYSDIFNVEDGDYKAENKAIVALSMDRIAIGYKKTVDEKEEEKYIFISPAEMSLFLLKLSAKLETNKELFEQKAKEVSEKQIEHEKKKKQAEKKKQELEKEKEPEIIKASGVKKFEAFKAENEAVDTEEKTAEAEPQTENTDEKPE